eukprot:6491474-Amphidinium_carterae.3
MSVCMRELQISDSRQSLYCRASDVYYCALCYCLKSVSICAVLDVGVGSRSERSGGAALDADVVVCTRCAPRCSCCSVCCCLRSKK